MGTAIQIYSNKNKLNKTVFIYFKMLIKSVYTYTFLNPIYKKIKHAILIT